MSSFVSQLVTDLSKVGLVVAAMVFLTLIELAVAQRPRHRVQRAHVVPNLALTAMTLATNTVFNVVLVLVLVFIENSGLSLLATLALPTWLDTVIVVTLLDVSFYFAHVVMHAVPAFWLFHRVHHSDAALDVTTTVRQHPMEGLIRYGFTATTALAIGASAQAFAVYRVLSLLNALLEHADFRLGYRIDRALSWIVVTPDMHKLHHSRSATETNSNYGNILSVLDRALGTFTPPERDLNVAYGLDGFDDPAQQSTIGLLRSPFQRRLASPHEPTYCPGSAHNTMTAPSAEVTHGLESAAR